MLNRDTSRQRTKQDKLILFNKYIMDFSPEKSEQPKQKKNLLLGSG